MASLKVSLILLGWFRKKGPSEDEVRSASFKMWFVGKGFSDSSLVSQGNRKPDMEIITRVMGPEIGYLTTPIILLQCALILLHQRNNLPKGGVFPPGIVFGPTDLQERLQENGISFQRKLFLFDVTNSGFKYYEIVEFPNADGFGK
ncbi:putative mitochondrial saccharopine dehydrogenase-like oxidoreductase [Prunus yedoensis var. nudiflora]|uniref:Putative mitochondrial saccharopine dehydrogenase-like oxidoreductase n=1 Tax=Prunus yedoensis var. nudiflora TaxID=2094558 RepID=A0A314XX87_PRUYE|nr:putative mitochondrial saccharopine dehydrogenase-like oxidoreductase [Prunus yedoensis var. nudiflora]